MFFSFVIRKPQCTLELDCIFAVRTAVDYAADFGKIIVPLSIRTAEVKKSHVALLRWAKFPHPTFTFQWIDRPLKDTYGFQVFLNLLKSWKLNRNIISWMKKLVIAEAE
jgi:hypothetical protein